MLVNKNISQKTNINTNEIKDILNNNYEISKNLANQYLNEVNKIAKRFEKINPKKNTINNYMVVKLKDLDKDNIPEIFIMYCDSSQEAYYNFYSFKSFF